MAAFTIKPNTVAQAGVSVQPGGGWSATVTKQPAQPQSTQPPVSAQPIEQPSTLYQVPTGMKTSQQPLTGMQNLQQMLSKYPVPLAMLRKMLGFQQGLGSVTPATGQVSDAQRAADWARSMGSESGGVAGHIAAQEQLAAQQQGGFIGGMGGNPAPWNNQWGAMMSRMGDVERARRFKQLPQQQAAQPATGIVSPTRGRSMTPGGASWSSYAAPQQQQWKPVEQINPLFQPPPQFKMPTEYNWNLDYQEPVNYDAWAYEEPEVETQQKFANQLFGSGGAYSLPIPPSMRRGGLGSWTLYA